ncbi:MAG: response regulator [Acidobacteria bacterium]|nr:response regulator [Acidobacteriota bacterium]MBI3655695.1 response regulator [Acidobacteriota bacterium]
MPSKILVIEDNLINRMLLVDILKVKGHSVTEADDGLSGITLAQEEDFDLILMDLNLPGIDGLSATNTLRNNPKTKSVPIIAITAHAMKGDEEKILASGCNAYIAKPIDTRQFVQIVAKFLA